MVNESTERVTTVLKLTEPKQKETKNEQNDKIRINTIFLLYFQFALTKMPLHFH